jgi:tRNA G18 (ribose-2'-O)-methylase SpoU
MIRETSIASLDLPALEPFRTLRQTEDHRRSGIFVAEGEKVVRRLLESPISIRSVLITPEWLEVYRQKISDRRESINVFVAKKELLEEIVGFNLHQGIMAVADIPDEPSLETLVALAFSPLLFVAVDGLTNSENLGVLVRNCVAFGVQGLIVGETSSSPFLRRAVRNSMGTVFKLPVHHATNLAETLTRLRLEFHLEVMGAHPHTDQGTLSDTDLKTGCCLVFGSEGEGISERVRNVCSKLVAISMQSNVDSLNVANASAVFLYEVQRQRGRSHGQAS